MSLQNPPNAEGFENYQFSKLKKEISNGIKMLHFELVLAFDPKLYIVPGGSIKSHTKKPN